METWLINNMKISNLGRVKQRDVLSGSAYKYMSASTQSVYVFWLLYLIHLHLR